MSQLWVCTPSSSYPMVARPCSTVRSPVTFMTGEPYCRVSELVEGGERRAGVVGLVAERAVELGGVADRLVDGQPEVRRVDDQVVAAGLDGRRRELLGEQLGQLGELGVPVVAVAGEVLPAAADRRGDRAHRVEDAGALRRCRRPRRSGCSRTRCWVVGCRRGRRRTCSPGPAGASPDACSTAGGGEQPLRSSPMSSADLLGERHRRTGRRRTPRPRSTSSYDRLGRELDRDAWSSPRRPARSGPRSRRPGRRLVGGRAPTPEAKPQAPSRTTRTAKPRSSASAGALERGRRGPARSW